ncbi:MAG: MaoC family dehydratase N-terminal domain-containing protein [Rhizobiales bacterium]|nr:MaoC family dehydratase N-terminal domain-containing protein [Hyphomicrobiales bacterium]
MAIDYDRLMALEIPPFEHRYTERDTMLYALGLGFGQDPLNEAELAFVYEKDLKVPPTMACVLANNAWMRTMDTGIDYVKVVHGEQTFRLHRPLPAAARVVGHSRVLDIIDKGAGKGAIVYTERTVKDADSGETLATVVHTAFCRGDGGFGGPERPSAPSHPVPQRAPDIVVDIATRPETALIYRLSGDYNPLHAEPAMAAKAGDKQPILHGLATFGIAGHAILKTLCDYDPAGLAGMSGRFSSPVFPGETIRTEIWREDNAASFQVKVAERNVIALSNGRAELAGA